MKDKTLKWDDPGPKKEATYCIPLWLRDEQVKLSTKRIEKRVPLNNDLRPDSVAVVCYGPSLHETWEQVKNFKYIISCSGSHKFLLEHGIVPTWHIEVDPRPHKIELIGKPHKDVKYLIASACHPKVFEHLEGHDVSLWHVFATETEALRLLNRGEWALTGGVNVGLRALIMARFLGFKDIHVFGMDSSLGKTGSHAGKHPNPIWRDPEVSTLNYEGVEFKTTPLMLYYAQETFHELDQMPGVKVTFHGDSLIPHVARTRKPSPPIKNLAVLCIRKPEIISPELKKQNYLLHLSDPNYGTSVLGHLEFIEKFIEKTGVRSILDYGCGKGLLAQSLPFPIWEFDPAIPGKDTSPRPAELVVCIDVLEHIEPEKLIFVLDELRRCVLNYGYFVIHTGEAKKHYANGSNAHLIQQPADWWTETLSEFFTLGKVSVSGSHLRVVVWPKPRSKEIAGDPKKFKFFDFSKLAIDQTPYIIGGGQEVIEPAFYEELVQTFPPLELFEEFGKGTKKFSLSERNHSKEYHEYIQKTEPWKKFHDFLKSPEFIDDVFAMLKQFKIELLRMPDTKLNVRFEFAAMAADGGQLKAHTDLNSKLVTIVISMLEDNKEWKANWGGGTAVLAPKNTTEKLVNHKSDFDKFEVVREYPYKKNRCVVFIKNDTSWHGVLPMKGPKGKMRKTLTINIERSEKS